jgi:D-alanine-D-alanine ligase-like ATP-grasp enzyme
MNHLFYQKREHRPDLLDLSLKVIRLLGLKDYASIDIRETEDGQPHIIDVNAAPFLTGLTFRNFAKAQSVGLEDMINGMVDAAYARQTEASWLATVGSSSASSISTEKS